VWHDGLSPLEKLGHPRASPRVTLLFSGRKTVGSHSNKAHALVSRTTPFFSNFLFTYLFSIKFLYFFIISSLFFLILSCSCQYSYNFMLTSNCMCSIFQLYGENQSTRRKLPTCRSHWQTLSHNVGSSTPRLRGIRTYNISGDRHWFHR
jgi:hypothetical protein